MRTRLMDRRRLLALALAAPALGLSINRASAEDMRAKQMTIIR